MQQLLNLTRRLVYPTAIILLLWAGSQIIFNTISPKVMARSLRYSCAPAGFGVLGSIDNTPGMIDKIVAMGGTDGFLNISPEQWVLYYRQRADLQIQLPAARL
jgi:hypothetical protein